MPALVALLAGAAVLPKAVHAQDAATPTVPEVQAPQHERPDRSIIVTGVRPSSRLDALSGVAVLQDSELHQAIRPSIGETLAHIPGVSASSFGPSASRPILRGLQGERVRVLTDGIGAIDVSNTSADHASIVNPLLAERIEVLRGPQSLLYGSSAIGGVINVIDRRVPSIIPDEPVHFGAIASYGSAANERSGAASLDVPVGGGFVVHADGSYAKTDDLEIGGFVLSRDKRREALASGGVVAANAALRVRSTAACADAATTLAIAPAVARRFEIEEINGEPICSVGDFTDIVNPPRTSVGEIRLWISEDGRSLLLRTGVAGGSATTRLTRQERRPS